jgi:superoxide dismutase, Fe-Mn family
MHGAAVIPLQGARAMPDPRIDRRTAMGAALATAAAMPALATTASAPAVAPRSYAPKPLPFDPAALTGLSEKLLRSHHENNYTAAVKRLAGINGEFQKLDLASAPGFLINGLKREELIAQNSMVLHEVYFSCLGAPAKPSAALAAAIERDFGSFDAWRTEYVAMGKALGGGSGWVVLNWMERDGILLNQWANDHTMAFAGGTPVLVLDMFEHAYAMDYGSKAGAYVDAYMANLNWDAATRRFAKLTK